MYNTCNVLKSMCENYGFVIPPEADSLFLTGPVYSQQ